MADQAEVRQDELLSDDEIRERQMKDPEVLARIREIQAQKKRKGG